MAIKSIKIGSSTFNIDYSHCVQTSGNWTMSGSLTSSAGFFDTSDERLKNFGEDVSVDFDALKNIPKKYFTWKEGDNDNIQIGTSAQAVKEIYPELVNEDENGTLSVSYEKLAVIALAAIDKLVEKNNELEERLAKLESNK